MSHPGYPCSSRNFFRQPAENAFLYKEVLPALSSQGPRAQNRQILAREDYTLEPQSQQAYAQTGRKAQRHHLLGHTLARNRASQLATEPTKILGEGGW